MLPRPQLPRVAWSQVSSDGVVGVLCMFPGGLIVPEPRSDAIFGDFDLFLDGLASLRGRIDLLFENPVISAMSRRFTAEQEILRSLVAAFVVGEGLADCGSKLVDMLSSMAVFASPLWIDACVWKRLIFWSRLRVSS